MHDCETTVRLRRNRQNPADNTEAAKAFTMFLYGDFLPNFAPGEVRQAAYHGTAVWRQMEKLDKHYTPNQKEPA